MANKCPANSWNWQRVMDWYGGEGGIQIEPVKAIYISQADRRILDNICNFLLTQGVKRCPVYLDKKTGVYSLRLARAEDMKTFVDKGRPYAPTEKACEEMDRVEELLKTVKPKRVYKLKKKKESLL
ncbi:MAG: LAGLIDADG family homing endonuclease [archaeon]|nr:LAGLIDADG family homing endonuclease [archaeon]MCP8312793.1 LAGLIDADG family homing endonuclease [archaeon]MCP8316994.1 LAGLIDADG family homing endonuclease [archaeon]MCP8322195.1 LAGLIDADG family homing endonuclease [archaeon]